VAVGARRVRRYGLYISETQDLADKHVLSVAALLESDALSRHYPSLGARNIGKYGASRGWRRNRLSTGAGFTLDSVGLDTAARGIKMADDRPDFIVIDDVDNVHDSQRATERKIATLTQSLLPAGSTDLAVLAVQNLIHPDSIFSRLAGRSSNTADFLVGRIVSGPFPAVQGLVTERCDGRSVIIAGTPLWAGQGLDACQHAIDTYGLRAFLSESQQEVQATEGGIVKREWWQRYGAFDRSQASQIIQVWDTAFQANQTADYSVCSTWALSQNRAYVLDVYRQRIEFPELVRVAKDQFAKWQPSAVLVEKAASGQSLIQTLQRETFIPVIAVSVGSESKVSRFTAVTPYIESGRVALPESAPWVNDWIEEHTAFPNGAHDDQVDNSSLALSRLFGDIHAFRAADIAAAADYDLAVPAGLFDP